MRHQISIDFLDKQQRDQGESLRHTPHFLNSFGQAGPLVSSSLVASVKLKLGSVSMVDAELKVGAEVTIVVLTRNVAKRAVREVVSCIVAKLF